MKRILCVWLTLLLLLPGHIAAEQYDSYYRLGSKVEDFSLVTSAGERVSLYGLLKRHKAVLLYFWFVDCGPSRYEFSFLQKAYESYGSEIAVLAIDPYDDNEAIERYRDAMGLTFMMAADTAGVTDWFVDYGFPTSVLIDRNSVVCYTECGAQNSTDAFIRLMTPFTLDDYDSPLLLSSIPSVVQPDQPDIGELNAALNVKNGDLSFVCGADAWPWIISENGKYILSSNNGIDNSASCVETSVYSQPGDALTFRAFTSSEEGRDVFAVVVDQQIVKALSGENPWRQYVIPLENAGVHSVLFIYSKNDLDFSGADIVGLDDVALLSGEEAQEALENVPEYPLTLDGINASLDFIGENAHEIKFDDPTGALNAFYGAAAYYLVSEENAMARIQLGAECDPGGAFIQDLYGVSRTMDHCRFDENGFLYSVPDTNPGLGWNALMLFPSLNDVYGRYSKVYIYFLSENALDVFCRDQIPDLQTGEPAEGITWHYAD